MVLKNRLIATIVRYPFRIMLSNLLLMTLLAAGSAQLYVESGIDIFFSKDDPNLLAERQLKSTYGREDNILFVIDAGSGSVFEPQNLATIEALTQRSWQIPNSKRVDSLTNFLHPEVDGDDIHIGPLVEGAVSLSAGELEHIRTTALSQPNLAGRLLAQDATMAAVNVNLVLPQRGKAAAIAESVLFARMLRDEFASQNPELHIHLAGAALTDQTLAEVTAKDSTTLMPALLGLVLVIIALLLRSILASIITVIAIFLSILIGMGFAGWSGIGLNSVNVSAPTIILTLAVADCIHVLSVFLVEVRSKSGKHAALTASLQKTLYPVTLTSITTALGFLTMNFSDSPPFRELGTIAAFGVLGALWVTLTVLPGLILLLPLGKRQNVKTGLSLNWLAGFVITRHNNIFWGSLLLIILAISFIPRIELNDDPSGYFSKAIPLSHTIELIETRLSGTQTLHYSFDSGQTQGVGNPEFLSRVDRFVSWLRAQPEVVNVESFTDTLKRLNQVMHEDALEWHRLPDSAEMAAQYILLYEISVPYGQDVTHQVSADKSSLKVTATLKNQKSRGLIAFEERSRAWMDENLSGTTARGAGQSVSFANVGMRNIDSMLRGSLVAVILISLCLIIAFRSVRFGLISFIPNLFPALITLGIWGGLVGEVNIAASVVFSLTLGIIVDDTTHFLVKYIEARQHKNLESEQAIRYTFENVGSALVSTSIVLAIGFLVLVISDFSVNATSGLLITITILIAIVLDLLFLPALLIKADRWLIRKSEN